MMSWVSSNFSGSASLKPMGITWANVVIRCPASQDICRGSPLRMAAPKRPLPVRHMSTSPTIRKVG